MEQISLKKDRLSDQVRKHLKQAIIDGQFTTGDRLPSEEQLAEMFQVSKVTAREALREMETEGIIEKRRGIYGGSFVARPGSENMGRAVINYCRFGGLSLEDLVEFRAILEPALVELAAKNRTPEDLEALKANILEVEQAVNNGKQNQPAAIEFHRLLADACHNQLISAVMEALVQVFLEILSQIPMTLEDAKGDLAYNRQFYGFLVEKQAQEARQLMLEHFDSLRDIIRRNRERTRSALGENQITKQEEKR